MSTVRSSVSARSRAILAVVILAVLTAAPLLALALTAAPAPGAPAAITTSTADATPVPAPETVPHVHGGAHSAHDHPHDTLQTTATSTAPSCTEALRLIPLQGQGCRVTGGLYQFVLDTGEKVLTHGPDPDISGLTPPPPGAGITYDPDGELPPVCAASPSDPRARLIYASSAGEPSNYALVAGHLRSILYKANYRLQATSAPFGVDAQYRAACAGGIPVVENAVLATPKGATTFTSILNDLRSLGYASKAEKYWVYYDGKLGDYSGQATLVPDDRLIPENGNNAGPSYAISYQHLSVELFQHESFHTMGAVQNSAPQSTGYGHCNDGHDVMCYPDGGPWANYDEVCQTRVPVIDCNHDSYFNPKPAPGTYLASNWNVASPLNRFLAVRNGTVDSMHSARIASLFVPYWVRPLETSSLRVFIRNDGQADLQGVAVQVTRDGSLLANVSLAPLARGQSTSLSIPWRAAPTVGDHWFTVTLLHNGTDPRWWSGTRSALVRVAEPEDVLRVAVVRHTTAHANEQTVWDQLQRDWPLYGRTAVVVDTFSLSGAIRPTTLESTRAHVLVVGDATYLTQAEALAIHDYVEGGRALLGYAHALTPSPARPLLAALLGLGADSAGTGCVGYNARPVVAFTDAVPALAEGQPADFRASKVCALTGTTLKGATVAATSSDGLFRVTTHKLRDAGVSHGVGLFVTWDLVNLRDRLHQGAASDSRLLYHAIRWAGHASLERDPVDGDVTRVAVLSYPCADQELMMAVDVANRGAAAAGAAVVHVYVDGSATPLVSWNVSGLGAGAARTLEGKVPALSKGTHSLRAVVQFEGDRLKGNDGGGTVFTTQACGSNKTTLSSASGEATVLVGDPLLTVENLQKDIDAKVADQTWGAYWLLQLARYGLGEGWIAV